MLIDSSNTFAVGPYVDNGDGTVTDQGTSLMWQNSVDENEMNYEEAYQYCADLDVGENADWRLPESNELTGLLIEENSTTYHCFIDPVFDCKTGYYMSNTSCSSSGKYDVGFGSKLVYCVHVTNDDYVRCVRNTEIAPVALFTGTPTTGTAPLDVTFTDQSIGNIISWTWDFGDGLSSTEQHPTHSYTIGTYPVSLTVTGPDGSDTIIKNDYISSSPGSPVVENFKTGLNSPTGIVLNEEGYVFVAEFSNDRVLKINPENLQTSVIADSNDGISKPVGLAIDSSGNLYVANNIHKITKIDPTGTITNITIDVPSLFGDIVYSPGGYLFVSEFDFDTFRNVGANKVLKINPENGNVLMTYTVGSGPYGLLYYNNSILVAHIDDHTLRSISLSSNIVKDLMVNDPPVASLGDIVLTNKGCVISTEIIPQWDEGCCEADEILWINIDEQNTIPILYGFDFSFGIAINSSGTQIFVTSFNDGIIHKITNFDNPSCKKCRNSIIPAIITIILD